jgi:alpha-tubulin suppressor-like RCC1 family protein
MSVSNPKSLPRENTRGTASVPRVWIGLLAGTLELGALTMPLTLAASGGTVVAWGDAALTNSCAFNVVAIATGYEQTLLLKSDGTVANCGTHNYGIPIVVPNGLANVVAVAGGYSHSLALKTDGTVVAWGVNTHGQTNVPAGLTNVAAISASDTHSLALRSDGTVVGWGGSENNMPTGLTNVVAIAAGSANLALKADGTVVGWNTVANSAYRNLTNGIPALTDVVAISAGWNEWLALKADGTVLRGDYLVNVATILSNVVTLAASSGTDHHISLAVKPDGTVVGWGYNFYGGPMVPPGLAGVVAVSSDSSHCLALVGGGAPFVANRLLNRTAVMSGKTYFRIEATGAWPLTYQWRLNGADLPGKTSAVLALTNLQPNQAGVYSVRVSNAYGTATGDSAVLTLRPLAITQQPQSQTNFVSGTAALGVTVQGIEPLHYRWQVDGADLAGATNSILILTNLRFSDTGVYSVIISNAYGTIVSSNATLTVVPSLIITQPSNQVTFVGGVAEFGVAAQGIEPISFQWKFNGADLDGATNAALSIASVRQDQAGSYSVVLSNAVGVARSSDAILSVVVVAALGNNNLQSAVPPYLTNVIAIAPTMALTGEGSVVSWAGDVLPTGLTNVVAIARGSGGAALKSDGTPVSWGFPLYPQPTFPPALTNAVAIAAGVWHVLALKSDGTVATWGLLSTDVTNAVAISAGGDYSLALMADGLVRGFGYDPYERFKVPIGLSNVVSVSAGTYHNLALLAGGRVVAWGDGFNGALNVPVDLTNVVAIAAGQYTSLALKGDGTVITWGSGGMSLPTGLRNVSAIVARGGTGFALIGDGPPVVQTALINATWEAGTFTVSLPTQSGRVYRLEHKNSLSDGNWVALPLVAGNGRTQTLTDTTASGAQRYYRVGRW